MGGGVLGYCDRGPVVRGRGAGRAGGSAGRPASRLTAARSPRMRSVPWLYKGATVTGLGQSAGRRVRAWSSVAGSTIHRVVVYTALLGPNIPTLSNVTSTQNVFCSG